jgi:hypothetical protein
MKGVGHDDVSINRTKKLSYPLTIIMFSKSTRA